MVTNFETLTYELTEEEKLCLPFLLTGLTGRGKDNPIKGRDIVVAMNKFLPQKGINVTFSEVRLRKMINHIRVNALAPVLGGSKGYYVSHDAVEIEMQIRSLYERAAAIQNAAKGLACFTPIGP